MLEELQQARRRLYLRCELALYALSFVSGLWGHTHVSEQIDTQYRVGFMAVVVVLAVHLLYLLVLGGMFHRWVVFPSVAANLLRLLLYHNSAVAHWFDVNSVVFRLGGMVEWVLVAVGVLCVLLFKHGVFPNTSGPYKHIGVWDTCLHPQHAQDAAPTGARGYALGAAPSPGLRRLVEKLPWVPEGRPLSLRVLYPTQPHNRTEPYLPLGKVQSLGFLRFGCPSLPAWLSCFNDHWLRARLPLWRDGPLLPPDPSSKYRVVVFSHGLGGDRSLYMSFLMDMVSHGYVVLALEHWDGSANLAWHDQLPGCPHIPAPSHTHAQGGNGSAQHTTQSVGGSTSADVCSYTETDRQVLLHDHRFSLSKLKRIHRHAYVWARRAQCAYRASEVQGVLEVVRACHQAQQRLLRSEATAGCSNPPTGGPGGDPGDAGLEGAGGGGAGLAAGWVRFLPHCDFSAVSLAGHSFGGATMLTVCFHADRYGAPGSRGRHRTVPIRCCVCWDPAIDWIPDAERTRMFTVETERRCTVGESKVATTTTTTTAATTTTTTAANSSSVQTVSDSSSISTASQGEDRLLLYRSRTPHLSNSLLEEAQSEAVDLFDQEIPLLGRNVRGFERSATPSHTGGGSVPLRLIYSEMWANLQFGASREAAKLMKEGVAPLGSDYFYLRGTGHVAMSDVCMLNPQVVSRLAFHTLAQPPMETCQVLRAATVHFFRAHMPHADRQKRD